MDFFYAQTDILFYKYNDISKDDTNYKNKIIAEMIISFVAEIPGYYIPLLLIDSKFFGRKRTLQISLLALMICCLVIIFGDLEEQQFIIINTLIRCFSGFLNLIYTYCLEVFPTTLRTKGIGLGSSMGKLSGTWIGWVNSFFFLMNFSAPLFFYATIAFMAIIVLFFLPETAGKGLDQVETETISPSKSSAQSPIICHEDYIYKKNE